MPQRMQQEGDMHRRVVPVQQGCVTDGGLGLCTLPGTSHAISQGWCERISPTHLLSGHYGADCSLSLSPDGVPAILEGLRYVPATRKPMVYIYEVPPRFNTW